MNSPTVVEEGPEQHKLREKNQRLGQENRNVPGGGHLQTHTHIIQVSTLSSKV